MSDIAPLSRVSVVLVEPQEALNVGSALRAVTNMGITDLRLVEPCHAEPERVAITAPGLESAAAKLPRFGSIDEAIADGALVVGFTARERRAQHRVLRLDDLGELVREHFSPRAGRLHLLFGREDFGLSNQALERCHAVVTIPTEPDYSSLNLAQAVVLAAWTMRRALVDLDSAGASPRVTATAAELEGLFGQVEQTLAFIEFFKFPGAAESVMATVRNALMRAHLDEREVQTFRGIFAEVVAFCRRKYPK